jgi:hypothetical protein
MRSAIDAGELPFGMPVEIEAIVAQIPSFAAAGSIDGCRLSIGS